MRTATKSQKAGANAPSPTIVIDGKAFTAEQVQTLLEEREQLVELAKVGAAVTERVNSAEGRAQLRQWATDISKEDAAAEPVRFERPNLNIEIPDKDDPNALALASAMKQMTDAVFGALEKAHSSFSSQVAQLQKSHQEAVQRISTSMVATDAASTAVSQVARQYGIKLTHQQIRDAMLTTGEQDPLAAVWRTYPNEIQAALKTGQIPAGLEDTEITPGIEEKDLRPEDPKSADAWLAKILEAPEGAVEKVLTDRPGRSGAFGDGLPGVEVDYHDGSPSPIPGVQTGGPGDAGNGGGGGSAE